MAKLDPALKHAITPPSFEENKLHRERLVDALHAELPRKLVVIAAPAGYGKTTLLADFIAHTEVPVCWVGLAEADRDVMRLASVLLASLERRFRRLRGELDLRAYAEGSPASLAQAFVDLVGENVQEAFALLFDEADVLNGSPEGLAFFDALCDRLPEQVTIYAAGREVLEVSLAKLMAEGALAGYGPHDLALTRTELADLAERTYGEELDDGEVDNLLADTTGWITGVILSGALAGRSLRAVTTNPRPMVYEYLASVVLNRQPEDLRRFLLDSSVIPVMTAQACWQVLETEHSSSYLERLVSEGLFVTRSTESPPSYEYHPLFREFLLDTKRVADPADYRELLLRAAQYLENEGAIDDAVQLYLGAGEIEAGYGLAERSSMEFFYAGRVETLKAWASAFDVRQRPESRLRVLVATALMDRGEYDAAELMLEDLFNHDGKEVKNKTRASAASILAAVAYFRGELDAADEWLNTAEQLNEGYEPGNVTIRCLRFRALVHVGQGQLDKAIVAALEAERIAKDSADKYEYVIALHTLATVQGSLGNMLEVSKSAELALEIQRELGAPVPLAYALNNLGWVCHITGRVEEALDYYTQALETARRVTSAELEALVLGGQADVFNDLGLSYQAAELYGRVLDLANSLGSTSHLFYACLMTSVLHRRHGSAVVASSWLKRAIELDAGPGLADKAKLQMCAIELVSAPGNALHTIENLLSNGAMEKSDEILAHFFAACAYLNLGDETSTRRSLEEAINIAGSSQLEGFLAPEMRAHPKMLEFGRAHLTGDPVLGVIEGRIETLERMARRYSAPEADVPESDHELVIRAFGKGELISRDGILSSLKPQVRELMFFLVDGGSANRDSLVEAFWPGHPPGRQIANLHMAVYSLRNALGKDAIQLDGLAYSLSSDLKVRYDVAEFEQVARVAEDLPPGDPRQMFVLSEAIRAYKGPFLLEFDDEWVLERRRNLEMRYLDLISRHADEALIRNQPERAVGVLREALAVDPYRDDLNLKYMELLGRMNRRSELVAHYQRYVNLLASDLGLDPSEDVRQVYDRLIG